MATLNIGYRQRKNLYFLRYMIEREKPGTTAQPMTNYDRQRIYRTGGTGRPLLTWVGRYALSPYGQLEARWEESYECAFGGQPENRENVLLYSHPDLTPGADNDDCLEVEFGLNMSLLAWALHPQRTVAIARLTHLIDNNTRALPAELLAKQASVQHWSLR